MYNLDPPPKYYQYLYDTNDTIREFTPLNDKEQVIEDLYIDKKYTQCLAQTLQNAGENTIYIHKRA